MSDRRHDPDELLRRIEKEERRSLRGKLVVFFGAAPGVGKTYAMLEAARTERDLRRDVVIGVVETHGRYETASLVIGLEMLPRRQQDHRGVTLEEFDLDAALARKPGLILIDELAHTNAPGARHEKRWQDVDELLDAGIDVYTTLNVQHVESLNDVVAQVTGVVVRETVPDRVLEEASEIRLIDLPPDELLERLSEGKVYLPERAELAKKNFFRKGNLIALRDLALRRTAEQVDAEVRLYRTEHGIERVWPTAGRILVGVTSSPGSARLVRAARRMAGTLHAPWVAIHVETPAAIRESTTDRDHLAANLRFAEQLGAETATISAESAAEGMVHYARAHNVARMVVGKPTHAAWRELYRRSFLAEIVRESGDIDVYVSSGADGDAAPPAARIARLPSRASLRPYLASVVAGAVSTVVAWLVFGRTRQTDVVMTYLLGIVVVAMRFGQGPSLVAAVLAVLLLDFFFVEPYLSFAVSDLRYVGTFGVMLFVATVISGLTQRIRNQATSARSREERTRSVFGITRELAAARTMQALAAVGAEHIHDVFDAKSAVLIAGRDGKLTSIDAGAFSFEPDGKEAGVVEWAWRTERSAGLSTDTLPAADALYVPLRAGRGRVGVLGVMPSDRNRFVDPEQRGLLEVFTAQIASALERARLTEEAQATSVEMAAERLRSSLLSAVSHDLRTPLAVIAGSASALVGSPELAPKERRELAQAIGEEARRLDCLVRNLLDMTKLTSGAVKVSKEWQPLEAVVGAALERLQEPLRGWPVSLKLPADLPPVPIDPVLVEQVLVNLLENAMKYTPKGTPLELSAHQDRGEVVVELADRGPGIPHDLVDAIFEKFYRLPREREGGGAGLGLAICRGIVVAHGGRVWADNREGGGATFHFTIPIEGAPPVPDAEDSA
jgi:two-component system, OmpR family, sensor histidine kinase KdpD